MVDLAILDYGAGNVRSVIFAFERLGVYPELTADPQKIRAAKHVVFPGVGAAGAALSALRDTGLDVLLPDLQQPVLGVCLGLQIMCQRSEEDETPGLRLFDTQVVHFEHELKVPHMGWNTLQNLKGPLFDGIENGAEMYFVHSYYAKMCEQAVASTRYGHPFSAALQQDNFYAVQFHPEKSGAAGERLLQNFLSL